MRKVGIIGLGHVGVTTAFNIIAQNLVDQLVLFETNADKSNAEYLDFKDALAAILTQHLTILMNDYQQLADADCVIFAAGQGDATDDGDRNSEIKTTKKAVDEVLPKLKTSGFHGILVNISNPCDVVTAYWQENLDLPKQQVLGTGTMLDTNRMRRGVAEAARVAVADVSGYNFGEHGESQFTAWSTVHIMNQLADQATLDQSKIEAVARLGGWTIFDGKHYTSYGIAMAAVTLLKTILSDSQQVYSVSYFDPKVQTYIGHLAKVGRQGIVAELPVALTADEYQKYQNSAAIIRLNLDKMKTL